MFWEILGKTSVALGVVYTALRVLSHIRSPKAALAAKLDCEKVVLPKDAFRAIIFLESGVDLKSDFHNPNDTGRSKRIAAAITAIVQPAMRESRYVVHGTIHNRGNVPVKDVQFSVPGGILASITPKDCETLVQVIDGVVKIGEILPCSELEVTVWSKTYFSESSFEKCVISHPGGTAKTEYMHRVNQRWYWLSEYYNPLIFSLWILLFLLALTWNTMVKRQNSNKGQEPTTPTAASPAKQETPRP